ncbi:transcriptional regulator [Nesterenkonia sandarakina]|nr:transcriptional regulator [Nesterenkonia sandarakina]
MPSSRLSGRCGPRLCSPVRQLCCGVVRLRICGMLARLGATDFAVIRDALQVSDPTLSKHLKQLAQIGYIRLQKGLTLGGRTKTWVEMTVAGSTVFEGHVAFLREVTKG